MTSELVRSKARELHAKTRRQLLGTLAGPLATAFFYGFGIREFPRLQRLLHPLLPSHSAGVLWGCTSLTGECGLPR